MKKISLPFVGIQTAVSLSVGFLAVLLLCGEFRAVPFIYLFGVLFLLLGFFRWISALLAPVRGALGAILRTLYLCVLFSVPMSLLLYALVASSFDLSDMDWLLILSRFFTDVRFWGLLGAVFLLSAVVYAGFLNRKDIVALFRSGGLLGGKGKLGVVEANLENSRFMTEDERDKIFSSCTYEELGQRKKDGVPVRALLHKNRLNVTFQSPCHTLIIGSTGSGKTTTFISPMIQLLGASAAGSSMLITDPKGELYGLHSRFLASRGYDVRVLDLRDAYHSSRWNPLEPIWELYREYAEAEKQAFECDGNPADSGLALTADPSAYGKVWYEFKGKAYPDLDSAVREIKIFRSRTFDELYEDMNDLVATLIPVQNQNDPMWEKGARSVAMGVLLAMLEDSSDERLQMTREKFNLFNLTKILGNSDNGYAELRRYFAGRDPLSKAVTAARQVIDAPDKTRSSYMSVVLEKLSLFNDTGICALTSASDFRTQDLAERPTALFVKIPDEKDTRHGLAAIFMSGVYKSLIKLASTREDLSLPRNVYYILDEFGNMPKIEKFDKMITVGRSRKIWFQMVVQSYTQLNNVYGDTVAEIVKGNCGIKMFIGSNDLSTCKEFSELCGNVTVVTESTSGSKKSEQNISKSLQTRPLIYPSELQKLNNKTSTGNSVIVTFGNYPLKTKFTPSYQVPLYQTGMINGENAEGRLFEEEEVFYDVAVRNRKLLGDAPAQQSEE